VTHDYRRGSCALTPLQLTDDGRTLTLKIGASEGECPGAPETCSFDVKVHGIKNAT
jgi:hypothetical protein